MSADYVLKFSCEVRKHVPEAKLVTLVGYMSLAEFAVGEIRKSDPSLPLAKIASDYQVQVSQNRPDGVAEQVPMTISQLVAMAQPVRQHREHCTKCPANIADRPFGCIAKINYPIAKESEEWLLTRLPADPNDPNLSMLFRFVTDVEVDGHHVDEMRPRLCELKAPLGRRWQTSTGPKQLTSSQLLHLLVFGGKIGAQQAALYTKLLGLETVLSDRHPPSPNIEQFKTLMCAIVMSGRLNAEIDVDA